MGTGEQVHVAVFTLELTRLRAEAGAGPPHVVFAPGEHVGIEDTASVLHRDDRMNMESGNYVLAVMAAAFGCRRSTLGSDVMQVRYRYRIYPGPGQQQVLVRTFGCGLAVYNVCVRLRDECHT